MPKKLFVTLFDHLHEAMADLLPTIVNKHIKEQVEKQVPKQVYNQVPIYVAEGLILERQKTKEEAEKMIAKAILQEHASVRSYMLGHILHVHPAYHKQPLRLNNNIRCSLRDFRFRKTVCRTPAVRPRDQDDPYDDAHLEGRKVQSGRRHQNMKHMFLESHRLDRIMNRNKVHQHQVSDYAETWLLWSLSVFIRSLVIWERVHDFQLGIKSYQQKVNLTAPTISFPEVKKHEMLSIIYEPMHGIIYKNSKKEKRVIRHSKIHKFCDETLNRVLEGLKSYNNDVRDGYNQRDLTKDEVKYLKLFE
uniref:Uncharacterized protein n=1 Tax=Tanacetum cinerariifolium TaxID=118510 RepID=A0A699H3K6_TANCI|nr:hypothetical protein [Tanacetum cinerariifolium]